MTIDIYGVQHHEAKTIARYTKAQLVELVIIAEKNWEGAAQGLAQQAENVKDWAPVVHGHWHDGGVRD